MELCMGLITWGKNFQQLRVWGKSFSLLPSMWWQRMKTLVSEISVLDWFKQLIKCRSQGDYSSTTASLCIISLLFKSSGHGEATKNASGKLLKNQRTHLQLRNFKMPGELSQTLRFLNTTKTWSISKKSKSTLDSLRSNYAFRGDPS